MPYIYSLAGMTYFKDYTIMRPLVMDFMEDTGVNNVGDQFMFGPAMMVAPVYEYGARSRDVYFPKGKGWYDYYTGVFQNGRVTKTVDAPYEQIPLYVRAGAIIPYGPEIQYSDEKPADSITLYVYKGDNGKFELYEDEMTNYNYEQGKYAVIPFEYNESTQKLTIGKRQGEFPGMLKKRVFNIVAVSKDKPQAIDFEAKGINVNYTGGRQTIQL